MEKKAAARRVRWWPLVVILVLSAAAFAWIWLGPEPTRQYRVIRTFVWAFFTVLLSLVWLLLLSRLRWRARLAGLGLVALVGLIVSQTVRIRGVTGDLAPILGWRWAGAELETPRPAGRTGPTEVARSTSDFPQFLGPGRNGVLEGLRLDPDWETHPPRQLWRRPIGAGWASFAVVGDLAVTQEQRGPEELVVAYELSTGEVVWAHADAARYETTVAGPGPRATPTIDGDRVFTLGATGILNALALSTGERIWTRQVVDEAGASAPEWGKSCSPLVMEGLVVVSAGGTAGASLVAYDRETGAPVWKGGSDQSGYSSPQLATLAGVPQIVILNRASVAAHDPADGRVLWEHPWPADQPNVAQPLPLPGDRLLVSTGYGIGSKMLRIVRDAGGGLRPEVVWESPRLKAKFAHYVPYEGRIYGLDDGVLVCLDPETGERCWKRGRYGHGQLLLAGRLLLIQAESGEVVLVEPDPEAPRELGRIPAFDRKTWNIPTLAGPYLLLRNDREAALYELTLAG